MLVHQGLTPPEEVPKDFNFDQYVPWRTEYDVREALRKRKISYRILEVENDLESIRLALEEFKPQIVFNLLEDFEGILGYDQHIVSYLELKKVAYTGCNPRGLTLARDKSLSKKILSYHRIKTPKFLVVPKNQKLKNLKSIQFPLIVKSLTAESSTGISQASVVNDEFGLKERIEFIHRNVETDAIVEEYVEGREFYVAILGNKRLTALPVWELVFEDMAEGSRKFATGRVKWNEDYRQKHGIRSQKATGLTKEQEQEIQKVCKRAYRVLGLSGYARIDIRFSERGQVYILEANPNPGIATNEEFSEAAKNSGLNYSKMIAKILSLGQSWFQSRS